MSKYLRRMVKVVFVLGVVSALAFGGRAALAADSASQCLCNPGDHAFCEECCMATGSVCPAGGGSEPRECICA